MTFRRSVGAFLLLGLSLGAGSLVTTQQGPRGEGAERRAPALRPAVAGPQGGVSTGHPLTTAAAFEILLKGGNAFDAGVASLIVGGVLEQDLYSLGGEALVLVYPKKEGKVTSIVGQGWAPKAVDVDWFTSRGKTLEGAGLDPAVVPGALHAALTVLEKWGTMSFADVSARAIEYAEGGFPMRSSTAQGDRAAARFLQGVAGQPALLAEAGRHDLQAGRDDQAADAGSHAQTHGRGGARREGQGPRRRHRRGARSVLQGRHREGDGRVPPEARRAVRSERLRRVLRARSRSRRRRRIAATPSTSTRSPARDRCCSRR